MCARQKRDFRKGAVSPSLISAVAKDHALSVAAETRAKRYGDGAHGCVERAGVSRVHSCALCCVLAPCRAVGTQRGPDAVPRRPGRAAACGTSRPRKPAHRRRLAVRPHVPLPLVPLNGACLPIRRKPEPFEARAPLHPGGSTTWQLHVIGNSRGQSGGCDTDWDKMPLRSAVSGSFASVLIGNISPSPQDLLDFNQWCLARLEHSTPRSRLFSALVTR